MGEVTDGVWRHSTKRQNGAVEPVRRFVEVDGARLAYEIAGRGDPLVLIHAGVADSRMWDDQIEALAQQFTVLRYDMRGFGQSSMPEGEYSHSADLVGLLRALHIDRADLAGVSNGARVAVDVTLEHPEMVRALVLTSPSLGGVAPSAETVQFWEDVNALLDAGDRAGAIEMELRRWVDGPQRSPDMVSAGVREKVREMDTDNFDAEEGGEERSLEPPAAGRLEEIHAPTLVILGDGDVPEIHENADVLVSRIPGSRLEVMPGVAHMLSMERPQEFSRLVAEFLNSL